MTALMPRLLNSVDDWIEAGFPFGAHMIRVEEYQSEDTYMLRAELPGLDPKEIKVSTANGTVVIEAERTVDKHDKRRSEFRYGSLRRVATLPPNAREQDIRARYDKGILEISVPLSQEEPIGRPIPIESV